jgi:hypothetical protein
LAINIDFNFGENKMEETLKFEFTAAQANLILAALGKLPAETSMNLILEIQKQAQPQLTVPEPEAE